MFSEIKETIEKWNKDRLYVGFDFGSDYAQLSYMINREEPETVVVPNSAGSYNIPTELFKRAGTSQWLSGQDARLAMLDHEEGYPVTGLLQLAYEKETVVLGDEEYAVADLVALYIKRSFALLPVAGSIDRIEAVAITVHHVDSGILKMIHRALTVLKLKENRVFVVSYEESFYGFMKNQDSSLRNQQVLLCELSSPDMRFFFMNRNTYSIPKIVTVEEVVLEGFLGRTEEPKEVLDGRFLSLLHRHLEGRPISCVYLIGDGFEREFCQESLSYLCRNRRVFRGNNLFCKGACFLAAGKTLQSEEPEEVFLGKDMLKANIGIRVYEKGEQVYKCLLEAGSNWFDAIAECDLILQEEKAVPLIVTPLNGKGAGVGNVMLEGLVYRKKPYHRIRLRLEMETEHLVRIRIRDLGFGEKEPPVIGEWTEEFEI